MDDSANDRTIVRLHAPKPEAATLNAIVHQMQQAAYVDAPWLLRQLEGDHTRFFEDLSQAYGRVGVELPVGDDAMLGQFEAVEGAPPPRSPLTLQDPWAYEGLRRLWDRVHGLNQARGRGLDTAPLLATLPTGQINARAVLTRDGGESAILFDDEIRSFAYMISKVVATVLVSPEGGGDDHAELDYERARDPVGLAPEAAQWFAAVLDNYIGRGWVRTLPPWIVPRPVLEVALVLCTGFEHFVMAHEYAHHSQGHMAGAVHAAVADQPNLSELQRGQAQEMEADAFGLQIACDSAVQEHGDPLLGFWGAYLACKSFELVDRTLYAVAHRTDWARVQTEVAHWQAERDVHPAPAVRAAALCYWFAKGAYEAPALLFANAVDLMFDKLFMDAFPLLVRNGQKGVHARFHGLLESFRTAPQQLYADL